MERAWFHTVLILLIILSTVILVITAKENVKLRKENELLILKSDSLHMLQIKTKKDLLYSNNKIDSLHFDLTYKKKRNKKK